MTTLNKPDLLTAMAAHVRGTGLAGASLRPLARAAGTSDRMLIYHFGTKGALIGALLDHLAEEMLSALSAALPQPRAETESACAAEIVGLLRTPTFRPYLRVWCDIVSAAGRAEGDHVEAARRILKGQVDWIASRLPEDMSRPTLRAREMLTLIQGVLVMEVAGMTDVADRALARFYPAG